MLLYLDCFSGASGDMLVGALLDLGLDITHLETELRKLNLPEHFHLHAEHQFRLQVRGVKFTVHDHDHKSPDEPHAHSHSHAHGHDHSHSHEHGHAHSHGGEHSDEHDHEHAHGRTHREIKALIEASTLSEPVKRRSLHVFHRIAVAEGKIHGKPPEDVGFHEVGALDSIVDIIGFCVGVEALKIRRVLAAPLVEGTGWVKCAHGRFPVPTPATLEILAGIPLTQTDEPHELLTPTGAALLAEFVEKFEPLRDLRHIKIGYGAGTRNLATRPNVVRAVLAELPAADTSEQDVVIVLETNLDDMTGEWIGDVQDHLFAAGALDVFTVPVHMKKNRPGVLLSVLAPMDKADALAEMILIRTSAFGVRRTLASRSKLSRDVRPVKTPFGPVSVKFGSWKGTLLKAAPEYESCRAVAARTGHSIREVYAAAETAARTQP